MAREWVVYDLHVTLKTHKRKAGLGFGNICDAIYCTITTLEQISVEKYKVSVYVFNVRKVHRAALEGNGQAEWVGWMNGQDKRHNRSEELRDRPATFFSQLRGYYNGITLAGSQKILLLHVYIFLPFPPFHFSSLPICRNHQATQNIAVCCGTLSAIKQQH